MSRRAHGFATASSRERTELTVCKNPHLGTRGAPTGVSTTRRTTLRGGPRRWRETSGTCSHVTLGVDPDPDRKVREEFRKAV